MRYKLFAVLLPCALALSACTTVTPAYKDNGTRSGPCVEGGPDDVAQKLHPDPESYSGSGGAAPLSERRPGAVTQ